MRRTVACAASWWNNAAAREAGAWNGWPATRSTTKNQSATINPARLPPTAPWTMTPCSARFMIAPSIRTRSTSPRNIVCAAPSATVRPRAPARARYGIFAEPLPILVSMTGHATPPELPPGLLEEYLAGMRPVLVALVGLAERLAAARNDLAALEALRRETHKIHGSAGSFGFMEVSRLAAGMEATVKDWISWPGDPADDRGSLTRWFVARLAEMLGLEVPRPAPPGPRPPPRAGVPPRPSQATTRPPPSPPLQRAGDPKVTPAPPPPRATPTAEPPARSSAAAPSPPRAAVPTAPPTPPAPPAPAGEVPEIVFVEDDAALAELLAYGLSTRGYRFVAYRNGREALQELLALDVRGTHPLLLLDVDLPALDGYSILDALQRARPGTYRVVFTTVHGTEEEQLRGLEAGALDYLVKPISLRVALEKIKRWVGGGREGRGGQ